MGLDFTAIDFETANSDRASVCSIGIAKVVNGRVVKQDSWYVNPPTGLIFTNTFVHGIKAADVTRAPSWRSTLDRLDRIVGMAPVVAYSPFDKSVYNAANKLTGHPGKDWVFLDALALARRHLALDSHRLPLVAAHLGLPPFDHHEAGADALACAQITLRLGEQHKAEHINDLWPVVSPQKQPIGAQSKSQSGTGQLAQIVTLVGDVLRAFRQRR